MVPEEVNSRQTILLADEVQLLKSVSALLVKGGYNASPPNDRGKGVLDVTRILSELHSERDTLEQAILNLER